MKKVNIYVGAACSTESGGYGVIVNYKGNERNRCDYFADGKNMSLECLELKAINEGLAMLKKPCRVDIFCSHVCQEKLTAGSHAKRQAGSLKKQRDKFNQLRVSGNHEIAFHAIDGEQAERCRELASKGRLNRIMYEQQKLAEIADVLSFDLEELEVGFEPPKAATNWKEAVKIIGNIGSFLKELPEGKCLVRYNEFYSIKERQAIESIKALKAMKMCSIIYK